MKKLFFILILAVSFCLLVFASKDTQLFLFYNGNVMATIPVDSIDSTAIVNAKQIKFYDAKRKILGSRFISQLDSMVFGEETFKVSLGTSKWEISSSVASAAEDSWVNSNKLYAQAGTKASVSYISTSSGGNASQPVRCLNGNNLSVSNLYTNDAIVYTIPVTVLAEGTVVDFMLTLYTPSSKSPKYWIFEYNDNGVWKSVEEDLKMASEDPSIKYSFYIKYFSSALYTTFVQSFKVPKTLRNTDLKMRCRVVGGYNNAGGTLTAEPDAYVGFVNSYYRSCYINTYQSVPVKDTIKVAVLGNSFTYYYGTAFMLKEIASSQGHDIRMRASLKGSQSFADHLSLELSKNVVDEGGYDYAILQDVSTNHSSYYTDTLSNAAILNNAKVLVNNFKASSPSVQPIVENTWSFMGSSGNYMGYNGYDEFDKALQYGSILVAAKTNSWESPIGVAFQKARAAGISDLYHTDNKHPNRNGSYLKACVNYLLLYGEPFDENVPNCLVDATTAKKLRDIAEDVVLKDINVWKNPDVTKVTFDTPTPVDTLKFDSIVLGENGIKTAAQLMSFASLWNSKGDVSSYKNASGEIALLNDIDLTGYTWIPIADSPSGNTINNGTGTTYSAACVPFNGVFNGNGYTISGMKQNVTTSQVSGMFGVVKGGTVKNVNLDASCTLSVNKSGVASGCAYGFIAGCLSDGVISNCNVAGLITSSVINGSSMVCLSGVVGHVFDTNASTLIENCTYNGSISNVSSNVMDNSNCATCAGIVGFGRTKTKAKYFTVRNCVNNASITASIHRTAGILASSSNGMHLEGCINYGTITNTLPSNSKGNRAGGIVGLNSNTSDNYNDYMDGCKNFGTIVSGSPVNGYEVIGGLAAIVRRTVVKNCSSNCTVLAPSGVQSRGVFVGMVNDNKASFTNNKVAGAVATGLDQDGNYIGLVTLTSSNYSSYFGVVGADYSVPSFNTTNIQFGE